ncbi:MAG: dihydroneopterin aldolase [Alphaproteobacteria bacterium]|nr:dihydroneopterin aldolase [Alphaproteobacteria bacterium]
MKQFFSKIFYPRTFLAKKLLTSIFIKDLILLASIGVHNYEKKQLQRIRLNLEIFVHSYHHLGDSLKNVVCYSQLTNEITQLIAHEHINLIETLAERICAHCFTKPTILKTIIKIEKLDVFDNAESVGVKIVRHRKMS